MKQQLIKQNHLLQTDFNKPFYVVVDPSLVGIAGYIRPGKREDKCIIQYTSISLKVAGKERIVRNSVCSS